MDTALFEEIFLHRISTRNYKDVISKGIIVFDEKDSWTGSHYIGFVSMKSYTYLGFVKVISIQRIENEDNTISIGVNIGEPFMPLDPKSEIPGKPADKDKHLVRFISWEDLFTFDSEDYFQEKKQNYVIITVSKEFQEEYGLPEKVPVNMNGIYHSIGTNQVPLEAIIGGIEEFLATEKDADPDVIHAYKQFLMRNYIGFAQDYMRKKNFVTALDLLKKVQAMFPEESLIHYHLGAYYLEKRQTDLAEEALKKAIELDGKNILAYNYLGATYAFDGKFDRAIEVWKRSLEIDPDNLLILMNIGKALLNVRKFNEAIRYFEKSVQLEDKNIQAYNYLALCHANENNTDEAISNWKTVLRLGGGDAYLYYNLGRACSEAGFFTVSIYMLEKAVEIFSDQDENLKKIAMKKIKDLFISLNKIRAKGFEDYLHFIEKQYNVRIRGLDEALCEIIDITEIDDFFAAELFRNKILFNSIVIFEGDENKVTFDKDGHEMHVSIKKEYVSSNKIVTPLVISLIRDGLNLVHRLDSEQQRESIEKNIRKNLIKDSMSRYSTTSDAGSEEGEGANLQDAIASIKEKLKADPDNEWLHYTLGSLYAQAGMFHEALEEFKIATNIDPDNSIAWHSCGAIYARLNMEEEALDSYKKAITVTQNDELEQIYRNWNYNNSFAYFDMAEIYLRKDKVDEAIIMFEKGLSIDVKIYLAHYQLGNCYLKKDKLKEALKSFQNSVAIQNDFAAGYNRIGYIYFQLEKWDEALENFKLSYSYDPNDPDTIFYLGQIQFLNGNYDEAVKYLQYIVTYVPDTKYAELARNILDKLDY